MLGSLIQANVPTPGQVRPVKCMDSASEYLAGRGSYVPSR